MGARRDNVAALAQKLALPEANSLNECPGRVCRMKDQKVGQKSDTTDSIKPLSHNEGCSRLHEMLEQLPLRGGGVNPDDLPDGAGIYYFYQKSGDTWEKSGHGNGQKGIVRIGISGGTRGRVSDHYHGVIPIEDIAMDTFCPKDRSIMRKHIGRALLNRSGHPHALYIDIWNVDMTTREKRDAHQHLRDIDTEKSIEREVSEVLARDFEFRCVSGASNAEVDELETSGIGIVASCGVCARSHEWLGRSHLKRVISEGKLWNIMKVKQNFDGPFRLDVLETRIRKMS